jgi:bifunctional DNA-binding transcriptional regulator/antitoxin component of YhaV-PrlF toxin-antitoxin module
VSDHLTGKGAFMLATPEVFRLKIASKRQVTLPQELVSTLHLQEGDEIEIVTQGSDVIDFRAMKLVPTSFFTEEILQKLEQREQELKSGAGFEVQNTSELRNRLQSRRSTSVR